MKIAMNGNSGLYQQMVAFSDEMAQKTPYSRDEIELMCSRILMK